MPYAAFLSSGGSPRTITVDSLTVFGIGAVGDSLIAHNTRLSAIYLPLDPDGSSCAFVFRYEAADAVRHAMADTITIDYEARPVFVSAACGVMYYYDIKDLHYTRTLIDSVGCPSKTITNSAAHNMQIYFRVNSES